MTEEVQGNPISQETIDLLNRSAVQIVAALIWGCRPQWPAGESDEERAVQIGHCSRFVLDALSKVVNAHALDLVVGAARAQEEAAKAMAEKPEVTQ